MGKSRKLCKGPSHTKPKMLPLHAFAKDRSHKDGLQVWCRDCQAFHRDTRAKVREAAVEVVEKQENQKGKLIKRNWPQHPKKRLEAQVAAMRVSFIENEGDIVLVSECLNIPIHEILMVLDKSEEMAQIREEGLRVKAVRAESELYRNADNGQHQAIKMVLTNRNPEEWSDRSQIDVRKVGFEPPEKEEVADIFSIVGVKKDA